MAPPLRMTLDQAAHDGLERRYQTTRDATIRTRYQMILLVTRHHTAPPAGVSWKVARPTSRSLLVTRLVGGYVLVSPHVRSPHQGDVPSFNHSRSYWAQVVSLVIVPDHYGEP